MRSSAVRRGANSGYRAADLLRHNAATHQRRARERPSVPPLVRPAEPVRPPIRLRYLLLIALFVTGGFWLEPRARAAWKVHGLATALADYGACMVGPTGPGLLRAHQVDQFRELVRRRIVIAGLGDAPFERCAPLATTLGAGPAAVQAHRAPAFSFAEYGGNPKPERSLADLAVTPEVLAKEARAAWPFVRGYAGLVKPSLSAREAAHPVPVAAPAAGRGLPGGRAYYRAARVERDGIVLAHGQGANLGVFRSTDGGATWKPVPASQAGDLAERCPAGSDGRAFTLNADAGGAMQVLSLTQGQATSVATLAAGRESVLAVACDERLLVAAVRPEGSERATLRQCAFAGACGPLPEPGFSGKLGLDFPLDLARVAGTTVLALTMGNVVRVTSSRDGGSWTPLAVAFDGGEQALRGARMPTRLLTVGRRLFLHGSAERANDTYGLLVSEDQGASFRGR
jgi:hypothetical protein